jgi:glycerophosphoryl diester phosphodiesterase
VEPAKRWQWRRPGRPLVFGHRGVRGDRPENTLVAFEEAAAQGADAIELDVRLCRGGEIVVIHDPTLLRVTGGADPRAVADLAWDELRRIDVGAGERVPRLSEALELARARGMRVNVEMKRDAPDRKAIVAATGRLLASWDARHPVIVSSFDPFMLGGLALVCSRPRALLMHRDAKWHERTSGFATPLRVAAVHLERTLVSREVIRRWHGRGMLVNVWTVNDVREALDLTAAGADGIITDAPARILEALRSGAAS